MSRLGYRDTNYGAKRDVESGLHFLLKAKRMQELIAERGLNPDEFRAKELNQIGDKPNSYEFLGGTLTSMSWSNYIKKVAEKTEKIEIVWDSKFEITNKETGEKIVRGWHSEWTYPRDKFDVEEFDIELKTVNSRYNVYSIDPTVYEDVRAFVISRIEAL